MDSSLQFEWKSRPVQMMLFTDIENPKELLETVKKIQDLCASVVDASLVCSLFAVKVAVCKAIENEKSGLMTSRSLFAEIILVLSGETNIGKAFRLLGLTENTKHLLFIVTPRNDGDTQDLLPTMTRIRSMVSGNEQPDIDLALQRICDIQKIQHRYKVSLILLPTICQKISLLIRLITWE